MRRSTAALIVVLVAAIPRLVVLARRARDDPGGVRRQERPIRRHARRARDVRVPPGRAVRIHAAALRLVPRRALLAFRSIVARRRARADRRRGRDRACSCSRSARCSARQGSASSPRCSRRCTPMSSGTTSTRTARCSTGSYWPLLVLFALLAYEDRSLPMAAATGCVAGLAILGNARLVFLPVAVAVYVVWRIRPGARVVAAAALVLAGAALVVAPWVARNKVEVGLLRDHDRRARAVEGEQPEHAAVFSTAAVGSTTYPNCPAAPPWPRACRPI